ncbi:ABC transporter permease [Promicromonospora thailandica]|uniref:ABC transporter permease n=1 Tax=Promicromonospora thailandica TaxID=765201 RepID=UPI0020A24C45|nr:ABC transporter permease [Promicromonospora thailandica]BFF16687.1 ABC transporter permease [Promicromonospora thailandica]
MTAVVQAGRVTAPGRATAHQAVDVRPRVRRLGLRKPVPLAAGSGVVLLLAVWTAGSATGLIDPRVLSAPWTVVTTGVDLAVDGRLVENLAVSLGRAAQGLAWGVLAGVTLALLSGLSRLGEALLDGPIQVKRAVPNLALLPLLILWFGIGEEMKVVTIALGVFIPIYIHTHNGLRSIDKRYVELAETLRLDRRRFVTRVVLPGALPGFLLGLRFAVTGSLLALVVVEQVNGTAGIGYMMELARTYGQTEVIVVGLVVYGVLGYTADQAVRLLQRRALTWRRTLED